MGDDASPTSRADQDRPWLYRHWPSRLAITIIQNFRSMGCVHGLSYAPANDAATVPLLLARCFQAAVAGAGALSSQTALDMMRRPWHSRHVADDSMCCIRGLTACPLPSSTRSAVDITTQSRECTGLAGMRRLSSHRRPARAAGMCWNGPTNSIYRTETACSSTVERQHHEYITLVVGAANPQPNAQRAHAERPRLPSRAQGRH